VSANESASLRGTLSCPGIRLKVSSNNNRKIDGGVVTECLVQRCALPDFAASVLLARLSAYRNNNIHTSINDSSWPHRAITRICGI
jgi:predicted patatin/cPLA2 family phospholipase